MNKQLPSEEIAEKLGRMADTCDNLSAALDMPLPFHIHKQALKGSLETMRNELREIHVAMTGENPWSN